MWLRCRLRGFGDKLAANLKMVRVVGLGVAGWFRKGGRRLGRAEDFRGFTTQNKRRGSNHLPRSSTFVISQSSVEENENQPSSNATNGMHGLLRNHATPQSPWPNPGLIAGTRPRFIRPETRPSGGELGLINAQDAEYMPASHPPNPFKGCPPGALRDCCQCASPISQLRASCSSHEPG